MMTLNNVSIKMHHIEENNDIEKIKYMIAFTCGYNTTYFNEELKEEMKDFDLRFNFEV